MKQQQEPGFLEYKRGRFTTRLPVAFRYSSTHFWIGPDGGAGRRIGLTKLGARLMGEFVDYAFQAEPGQHVTPGQVIGWIEGFKANSDLYCIAEGAFVVGNPVMEEDITIINQDPCGAGWLYAVTGLPDQKCFDAAAYAKVLDETIDRLVAQQRQAE